MYHLITRLHLLAALVLPFLLFVPPRPPSDLPLTSSTSTLSDIGIYPLVANGKTDISIALCSDNANFQLRSEQPGVFLSQIYVRSTSCPVRVASSWRIVVGAVAGECFIIYAWASEALPSEAGFMARATRYSVCVTGLGQISSPQRQTVTAPAGAIETPADRATVQGSIAVNGWVIDAASWSGPGVDQVQLYSGATLLGTASYGQARPDIAAAYGDSRYTNSGYTYQLDTARLPYGTSTIQIRYHSAVSGQWSSMTRTVNRPVATPVDPPQPPQSGPGWKVPFYWQGDPQWQGNKFTNPNCSTIGQVGCALTSLAMIFKYYGANYDPGTLNGCLGKDACALWWGSPKIMTCSGGKVRWEASVPNFSYAQLEQELKSRPVILELSKGCPSPQNPNGRCQHFVVVLNGSGNNSANYVVNDPGLQQGARTTLNKTIAWFHGSASGMRLYSGTPAYGMLDVQPSVAQLRPLSPHPSAGELVTGTLALYRVSDDTDTNTKIGVANGLQDAAAVIGSRLTL